MSESTPYSAAPIRSANSVWLSYTHSAGGGTRGNVTISLWTGIEGRPDVSHGLLQ